MKKSRINVGGGGRIIALTVLLTLILQCSVFALDPGDTVDFSFDDSSMSFFSGDYIGKCMQAGVDAPEGDMPAKVLGKIDNSNIVAKLAYYYTYVDPWALSFDKPTDVNPQWGNLPSQYGKNYALTVAIQYAEMGADAWRAAEESSGSGFSIDTINCFELTAIYMINEAKTTTVPDEFEICRMRAQEDRQIFNLWKMGKIEDKTGKLKLKKMSANTGITG